MILRRTVCGAMFAAGTFGLVLLDAHLSTGQPGGGGFGKGGGRGGGGFGGGAPGGPGGGFGGGGPGGGGFGKGGGGFGGGKSPFSDPSTIFNFYSKGADVIDFSRMDPNMKAFAKRGFEKAGLPAPTETTVITKAQFVESFTRAQAAKGGGPGGGPPQAMTFRIGGDGQQRGFGGPPPGGFGGGGFGGPPPGGFGGGGFGGPPPGGFGGGGGYGGSQSASTEREKMGGATTFRMTDQDIERKFQESDVNRDGKLSPDEISDRSPLKASFKESDTSQDGYIDLNEYKAYIAMRIGGDNADPTAGSYGSYAGNGNYGNSRDPRDLRNKQEELPVAIRFGKLPSGLPSWWDTLDTDKDGQVGLYEWRADGRDMKEFQKMDLDSDGVLAPNEWLRYNVLSAEQAKAIAAEEEIGGSSGGGTKSGRPSFGGAPGFGGGAPGGYGGFGKGGNKGNGSSGSGKDSKNSERDAKNPFRSGGKR